MTAALPAPPPPGTDPSALSELGVPGAPAFGFSRLLLVVTGSTVAGGMPQWLTWLRREYPELEVEVVMTRSAHRFVTPLSLGLRLDGDVLTDDWAECGHARHVEHAEWAEAVLVYPATFHFTARFALGLADTPTLLALHCTDALVALAPSLPPGGLDSPAFRSHWETLAARPDVVMVPPIPGHSMTTGRSDGWVPPPLPEALRRMEERRVESGRGAGRSPGAHDACASVLADGARP